MACKQFWVDLLTASVLLTVPFAQPTQAEVPATQQQTITIPAEYQALHRALLDDAGKRRRSELVIQHFQRLPVNEQLFAVKLYREGLPTTLTPEQIAETKAVVNALRAAGVDRQAAEYISAKNAYLHARGRSRAELAYDAMAFAEMLNALHHSIQTGTVPEGRITQADMMADDLVKHFPVLAERYFTEEYRQTLEQFEEMSVKAVEHRTAQMKTKTAEMKAKTAEMEAKTAAMKVYIEEQDKQIRELDRQIAILDALLLTSKK